MVLLRLHLQFGRNHCVGKVGAGLLVGHWQRRQPRYRPLRGPVVLLRMILRIGALLIRRNHIVMIHGATNRLIVDAVAEHG